MAREAAVELSDLVRDATLSGYVESQQDLRAEFVVASDRMPDPSGAFAALLLVRSADGADTVAQVSDGRDEGGASAVYLTVSGTKYRLSGIAYPRSKP